MALPQVFNRSQHLIIKMPLKYTLTTKGTPIKKYTLLAALLLAPLAAHAIETTSLTTEYLENPLGIDTAKPRLSWIVQDSATGAKQMAYQVQVASSPEKLARGEADLWDSGKVGSDETLGIEYGGKPLAMANLSAIVISWLYWFCQRDWFPSPVIGMRWVGLVFGIIVTFCGFIVILTTVRSGLHLHSRHEGSVPIAKGSYRRILALGPMRRILVALLSIMIGFTLVGHLGFYIFAFHACGGDLKKAALIGAVKATVVTLVAVIACPLIGAGAKRYGKDLIFKGLIIAGVLSSLSMWWLITPVNPYLSMISDLGVSVSLAGFWLLMPAYLGDISDYYERTTGQSCQGILSALTGNAVKIGASASLLLTGYILILCGFHAEMPHEAMTRPIFNMRILYAVVPSIGLVISYLAMAGFRCGPDVNLGERCTPS